MSNGYRPNSYTRRYIRDRIMDREPWCYWCGRLFTSRRTPTLDHVVERRYGGRSEASNIVLSCSPCNNSRSNDSIRFQRRITILSGGLFGGGPHTGNVDTSVLMVKLFSTACKFLRGMPHHELSETV